MRLSLDRYLSETTDRTPLRIASNELHQVAGTLKLAELEPTARVAEEAELTLSFAVDHERIAKIAVDSVGAAIVLLRQRFSAIGETGLDSEIDTIAVVNQLRITRGAVPVDLVTVFNPDLTVALPADIWPSTQRVIDPASARRQFQATLLRWVNNQSRASQLGEMAKVFAGLGCSTQKNEWRRFWWVAQAFVESCGKNSAVVDRDALSLFRGLDEQIKLFGSSSHNTHDAVDTSLALRLLFAIMQSNARGYHGNRVYELFQLAGTTSADEASTPAEFESAGPLLTGSSVSESTEDNLLAMVMESSLDEDRLRTEDLAPKPESEDLDKGSGSGQPRDLRKTLSSAFIRISSPGKSGQVADGSATDDSDTSLTTIAFDETEDHHISEDLLAPELVDIASTFEEFASNQYDLDLLNPLMARIVTVISSLDNIGHVAAGDVCDYCRRMMDGLQSGRITPRKRIIDAVTSGIDAVNQHLSASKGSGPLRLESLNEAEGQLRELMADAHARVLLPDTMRQDTVRQLKAWRTTGSARHHWRDLCTTIDNVTAFATAREHGNLRLRSQMIADLVNQMRGRLSAPTGADIEDLDRLRDALLTEFELVIGRDEAASSTPSVAVVGGPKVESLADVKNSSDLETDSEVRSSLVGERKALIKLIRRLETRVSEIGNESIPASAESDIVLGFRLVREKGERNGLAALTDIARISENLIIDIKGGVALMSPAVIQFLNHACVRLFDLTKTDPMTDANADIQRWNLAAVAVRNGTAPDSVLGDEINVTDRAVSLPDELMTENSMTAESSIVSAKESVTHPVANDASHTDGNAGLGKVAIDENAVPERDAPESAGASSNGSAVAAGVLAQQVLASVGANIPLDVDQDLALTSLSGMPKADEPVRADIDQQQDEDLLAKTPDMFDEHNDAIQEKSKTSGLSEPCGDERLSTPHIDEETEPANVALYLPITPDDRTENETEQETSHESDAAYLTQIVAGAPASELAAIDTDALPSDVEPDADMVTDTDADSVIETAAGPNSSTDTDINAAITEQPTVKVETTPTQTFTSREGDNIEVLVGEAQAHLAYIGQWIEQGGAHPEARPVDDELARAVSVLRTIAGLFKVECINAVFDPLDAVLVFLRTESLSIEPEDCVFIRASHQAADTAFVTLGDGKKISNALAEEMIELGRDLSQRLDELRRRVGKDTEYSDDTVQIKIIGDDIVTLEQLAGNSKSDQLDLDTIFRDESEDLFRRIREATFRWRDEHFSREARSDLLREFHTLKGNARTAGFPEAASLAHSLETLLGQQQPSSQEINGLHGEDVLIYLNQASDVLSEFIERPDSERTRDSLEVLKNHVDAKCVDQTRSDREDDLVQQSNIQDVIAEQTIRTRDLATVASSSYTFGSFGIATHADDASTGGFQSRRQDIEVMQGSVSTVETVSYGQIVTELESEQEPALPNSLMTPALVIAESRRVMSNNRRETTAVSTNGKTSSGQDDPATVAALLVEELGDRLSDFHLMTQTMGLELNNIVDLQGALQTKTLRIRGLLDELDNSKLQAGSTGELSQHITTKIRGELDSLSRDREELVIATERLVTVRERHHERVTSLRQELRRVRCVAIESIASRLRLVVRRTAQDMKKEVKFAIRGGELEMDRHILDAITGSLENLLRNAVVHGIELPTDRQKAKKSRNGTVELAIRHDSDTGSDDVLIEVSDDGAGVNVDALRRRVESMLKSSKHSASQATDELTDAPLIDRVFDAGVTTVDETSELAGRGVGLDVVRATLALLGGRVSVRSRDNEGACFSIRLPADLETMRARIIGSDPQLWAIAEHHIKSSVQIRGDDIDRLIDATHNTFDYEGQTYPLLKLSDIADHQDSTVVASDKKITILLLHLVVGDIALQIPGGDRIARVACRSGTDTNAGTALVLPTTTSVNWLDLAHAGDQVSRSLRDWDSTAGNFDQTHSTDRQQSSPASLSANVPSGAPLNDAELPGTVVFVADRRDISEDLVLELEKRGIRVEITADSLSTLSLLEQARPGIVVIDLDLPGGDGFELIHQINKSPHGEGLPLLVVSSIEDEYRRNRLSHLAVVEVIAKPCDNEHLIRAIVASSNRK